VSGSFSTAQIAPERGRFRLPLLCFLPQATCRDSNSRSGLIHPSLPETHVGLRERDLIKAEKIEQLPSKAPFSKRFEEIVGHACESAAARQVARRFGLAESTVRAIDLRYLERWAADRREPPLRQMGVDEIHIGKKQKFLTVTCNLETGEPLWFGRERKKETLDAFFREELSARQRRSIEAACVDIWEPSRLSLETVGSELPCRV
jgi:transposase